MRRVSEKRAVLLKERKALREDLIGSQCELRLDGCAGLGTDWHEILTRARGGSIVDPENRAWLCRPCHSFVTDHPSWADRHGWTVPSWSVPSVRTICGKECEEDHRGA